MGIRNWFGAGRTAPILDIFTITIGREDYLPQQLETLLQHRYAFGQHIFVQNGCEVSPAIRRLLGKLRSQVFTTEPLAVGACIEAVKQHFSAPHTMKLDDDALPVGERFFAHLHALIELMPDRVFSPYPVGLLRNPGGPGMIEDSEHEVLHSACTDTWYTLRPVQYIGGFARVAPTACYDKLTFRPNLHKEDADFSRAMRQAKVPMCYLENALIVEHAETVRGQLMRNPAYFQGKQALRTAREAEGAG